MYTLLRNHPQPRMEEIEDAFQGKIARHSGPQLPSLLAQSLFHHGIKQEIHLKMIRLISHDLVNLLSHLLRLESCLPKLSKPQRQLFFSLLASSFLEEKKKEFLHGREKKAKTKITFLLSSTCLLTFST